MPNPAGTYCSAAWCNNNQKKCPQTSFYRFPKDIERCKKWIAYSLRPDLLKKDVSALNNAYRLCGDHFDANQHMHPCSNKLIRSAVPTVPPKKPLALKPSVTQQSGNQHMHPCSNKPIPSAVPTVPPEKPLVLKPSATQQGESNICTVETPVSLPFTSESTISPVEAPVLLQAVSESDNFAASASAQTSSSLLDLLRHHDYAAADPDSMENVTRKEYIEYLLSNATNDVLEVESSPNQVIIKLENRSASQINDCSAEVHNCCNRKRQFRYASTQTLGIKYILDNPIVKKLKHQSDIKTNKLKKLKSKLRYHDRCIQRYRNQIKELKKSNYEWSNAEGIAKRLSKYITGFANRFVLSQLKAGELKVQQWTDDMKYFCLTLYKISPNAYHFLRTIFVLPQIRTLQIWKASMRDDPDGKLNEYRLIFESYQKAPVMDEKLVEDCNSNSKQAVISDAIVQDASVMMCMNIEENMDDANEQQTTVVSPCYFVEEQALIMHPRDDQKQFLNRSSQCKPTVSVTEALRPDVKLRMGEVCNYVQPMELDISVEPQNTSVERLQGTEPQKRSIEGLQRTEPQRDLPSSFQQIAQLKSYS